MFIPTTTAHGTNLVSIVPVSDEVLPGVWEKWSKDHIAKCIPHQTGYTLEDVYEGIQDGPLTLWVVWDAKPLASFTTCVCTYPQEKVLECVHLGGEGIESWGEDMANLLDEVAKCSGCSAVVSIGRRGTEKLYKQWDFEFEAVRLRRRVI